MRHLCQGCDAHSTNRHTTSIHFLSARDNDLVGFLFGYYSRPKNPLVTVQSVIGISFLIKQEINEVYFYTLSFMPKYHESKENSIYGCGSGSVNQLPWVKAYGRILKCTYVQKFKWQVQPYRVRSCIHHFKVVGTLPFSLLLLISR